MQEEKINQIFIFKSLVRSLLGFTLAIVTFGLVGWLGGGQILITILIYVVVGGIAWFLDFVMLVMKVMTFSYILGDDFIIIKQGVINRSEKHLPYAVIQDIIVGQDLLDRVFGLTRIIIENASMSGSITTGNSKYGNSNSYSRATSNMPGMYGNRLVIPGLSKAEVLKVRDFVLNKTQTIVRNSKQSEL